MRGLSSVTSEVVVSFCGLLPLFWCGCSGKFRFCSPRSEQGWSEWRAKRGWKSCKLELTLLGLCKNKHLNGYLQQTAAGGRAATEDSYQHKGVNWTEKKQGYGSVQRSLMIVIGGVIVIVIGGEEVEQEETAI